MEKAKIRNSLLLLLTAFIWGVAFVAQSVGMEYVGPFTFNSVRCFLGGMVLIPCIWLLGKLDKKAGAQKKAKLQEQKKKEWKNLFLGGTLCGILLCLGSNLQQFGIQYTTVGKAGFITAFYIIIVPILGLFLRRRCGWNVWFGGTIFFVHHGCCVPRRSRTVDSLASGRERGTAAFYRRTGFFFAYHGD